MEKIKKVLKHPLFDALLIIVISGTVIYFSIKDNYQEVFSLITSIDWKWFLFLAVWVILHQGTMGWLLSAITRSIKKDYTFSEGMTTALSTSFFNGISPGATGGQIASLYIHRKQGLRTSDSVSILWFDFMIYQGVMASTVFVLLILGRKYFWSHHSTLLPFIIAGFIVSISIILGLWAITRFSGVYNWISTTGVNIGTKLRIIKDKQATLDKLDEQIELFETSTQKFKHEKKLAIKVIIINILRNLMHFAFPFICSFAIVPDIGIQHIIQAMTLMACIDLIDVFIVIPGAAGGTEILFTLLFGRLFLELGYSSAVVSSVLLVWRFFSYYFIMIVGGLTFITFKFSVYRKEKAVSYD